MAVISVGFVHDVLNNNIIDLILQFFFNMLEFIMAIIIIIVLLQFYYTILTITKGHYNIIMVQTATIFSVQCESRVHIPGQGVYSRRVVPAQTAIAIIMSWLVGNESNSSILSLCKIPVDITSRRYS